MGVNLLQNRRRMAISYCHDVIPPTYQRVAYLARTSELSQPYSIVNISITAGDVVRLSVSNSGQAGTQRAFGGQSDTSLGNRMELYYNANDALTCWTSVSGGVTIDSREYGENGQPDVLTFTVNTEFTLYYWGIYRSGSYLFDGRMYYLTVTGSNGQKKHDLVPCVRRSDGEPGFYDAVTHIFYTKTGDDGNWIIPE